MGRKRRKPLPRYIGRALPAPSSTETLSPPSAHPILICATGGGSRLVTFLEPCNLETVSQCRVHCYPYGGLNPTALIRTSFDPLGVTSQTERYGSGRTTVFHLFTGQQVSQIRCSAPYCLCGVPESSGATDACFEFPLFVLGSSVYDAQTGKSVCRLGGDRRTDKASLWEWRCSRWVEEWGCHGAGELLTGGTVSVRGPALLRFDVRSGRTEPVGRYIYDTAWQPPYLLPHSEWKVSSLDADAAGRIVYAGCERCKHLDVWDRDGQSRITTVPLSEVVTCLRCVPDLNYLVVGLSSGNIEVVDLRRTNQSLRVLQRPTVRPHVSRVRRYRRRIECLEWIENSLFVCSSLQGKIATLDIITGKWKNQILSNCECVNVFHQSDPTCCSHLTADEEERFEFLLSFLEQGFGICVKIARAIIVHLHVSLVVLRTL